MRADNQGEGGILALMTMTGARLALVVVGGSFSWRCLVQPSLWRWNYYAGNLVLSAVEGLNVATSISNRTRCNCRCHPGRLICDPASRNRGRWKGLWPVHVRMVCDNRDPWRYRNVHHPAVLAG